MVMSRRTTGRRMALRDPTALLRGQALMKGRGRAARCRVPVPIGHNEQPAHPTTSTESSFFEYLILEMQQRHGVQPQPAELDSSFSFSVSSKAVIRFERRIESDDVISQTRNAG